MSSTLFNVARASDKEVERLERLAVQELRTDPASNKDQLYQSHRVRLIIEQIISTIDKLVEICEDKDGERKDENATLDDKIATGTDAFSAFYDRLKHIRDYHRRATTARVGALLKSLSRCLKKTWCLILVGRCLYFSFYLFSCFNL